MSETPPPPPPPSSAPPPPDPYQQGAYQQPAQVGSGLAIAALVLGILSLPAIFTVIGGILLGLIAIVLGIIAVSRAKRGTGGGRGMAITGIVLGAIGLLASIAIIVAGVSILNSDSGKTYQQCVQDANGDQAKVQQCAREFSRNLGGN